jgi:hypothetical protein
MTVLAKWTCDSFGWNKTIIPLIWKIERLCGGTTGIFFAYHLRPGCYVRVVGHYRSFNDKKSVVAYRIVPIVDFNEITYHFLECIHVHLQNTRGPLVRHIEEQFI